MRLAIFALLGLFGLAACDDSVQFRLRIEWQRATAESSAQACPQLLDGSYSCRAIPLSCDVQVRVRIVGATNDVTYYSDCFPILSNGDACQLAALPIESRAIPNEMVRVQVIVWTFQELMDSGLTPAQLAESGGCPVSTPFDVGGLPRLGATPVQPGLTREPIPALGGETYFLVGQSPTATVTLGCPKYPSLDAPVCRDDNLRIQATIRDPNDFFSIDRPPESANMSVQYGLPVESEGVYRVVSSGLSPALDASPEGTPLTWNGVLLEPPGELGCLVTDRNDVAAPSIHCFDTTVPDEGTMIADGFQVGSQLLRDMRRVLSLIDVPPEGIVLGVVVDADGQPVANANVTADGASIVYPDDSFVGVRSSTNSKGFFISRDAGFETEWRATGPNNTRDDGSARGGLVEFYVSVVVVRLDGSAAAPP